MILDIPNDIFRCNVLKFVNDVNELINLSAVQNIDFRRYILICFDGYEFSHLNSHSGRYLFWLLRMGITTKSVLVTGVVGDDELQMLISIRKCKSISFQACIRKQKMIHCRSYETFFLQNSHAATAHRQLEEVNFYTNKSNIEFKMLCNCPNLHTIRIYDADDAILRRVPEYSPNIRAIGLGGDFTDEGLNYLLERCPFIE